MSSFFLEVKRTPKSFSPFLFLSFANTFLVFTFLAPFFWNSQKFPISQNIGCLMKTQWKNSTQTIFQGSSPWATLILDSVFVVVVLYCVQLFFGRFFPKIILSFPFPFLCEYVSLWTFPLPFPLLKLFASMVLLLDFYGIPYEISMVILWYF